MRIAYLHYLVARDTALNHVRQFAAAGRALGADVAVHPMNLAPEHDTGTDRSMALQLRGALKRQAGRFLHEPKELWWNLRYARAERRILHAAPIDVLLVRDNLFNASFVHVARRLALPLVLEVNAPAAESRLYLDQYAHLPWVPEWLEGWKLRCADAVTVVSSGLKAHLVSRHRVAANKIAVVPNGADLTQFGRAASPDPAARQALAVSDDTPVVGFIGSFQKWHGTDLLAGMTRAVAAARPNARFLFVGDGPEMARLREATALLGDRVLFTGMVPHERVPGLVAGIDVGVLPEADFYRCPLKVIEWMAAGRAIVAPRYPPLRDLIDDGVHGVLVPPRDVGALTGAVLRCIDSPSLRGDLGAAASARAHASLSWTDNARRVLSACESARARHRDAQGELVVA